MMDLKSALMLSYEEFEEEILGSTQLLQTTFGQAIATFSMGAGQFGISHE